MLTYDFLNSICLLKLNKTQHLQLKDHAVKVRMTAASTRHVLTCLKEEIIHVTATLVSLEMEHNAQVCSTVFVIVLAPSNKKCIYIGGLY